MVVFLIIKRLNLKRIKRDKRGNFVMLKVLFYKGNKIVMNINILNNIVNIYIK